jgi:hypothetical protein
MLQSMNHAAPEMIEKRGRIRSLNTRVRVREEAVKEENGSAERPQLAGGKFVQYY